MELSPKRHNLPNLPNLPVLPFRASVSGLP